MAYKFNPFTGQLDDAITLTGSGSVAAAQDGTEALPGISFANDLNTGIYRPGVDQVAISTNGTRRFNVASDGTIHIGNGTVNAAGVGAGPTLSVTGDAPEITLRDSATGNPYAWMASNDSGSLTLAADHGNNAASSIIDFEVDGTERMRLDSSGRLGLGISSPGSVIHAKGGSISSPATASDFISNATARFVVNHVNEYGLYIGYANGANDATGVQVTRSNGTVNPLLLNPYGGNVGVNTTSPTALLDISSDVFRLRTAKTPASATDTGNAGDICWDANYVYVCVATNTWKRSALSTW